MMCVILAVSMPSLKIAVGKTKHKTFHVAIDRRRFERLADIFGFFSSDFLASLARSEKNIIDGKVKKLRSLKDLT